MVKTLFIFLALTFLFSNRGHSQKQLVMLRNERVLLRLSPGDQFVFRLKNSARIHKTYVNNLSDTSVVTHNDTVSFNKIDRIYFRRRTLGNVIGSALVVGGTGLFLIDQLNYSIIQGNDPSLDRGVARSSLISIAVGLPFMLIKKKSQRVRYPYRLRMVKPGSMFYLPDSKGFTTPYID